MAKLKLLVLFCTLLLLLAQLTNEAIKIIPTLPAPSLLVTPEPTSQTVVSTPIATPEPTPRTAPAASIATPEPALAIKTRPAFEQQAPRPIFEQR